MQIRKGMLLFTILCFCIGNAGFSQETYNDFLQFKMRLYNTESQTERQAQCEKYRTKIETAGLSVEETLTLLSLLTIEQADMTDKSRTKEKYMLLSEQNARCTAFMAGKKNSAVNERLLTAWADIKSRLMAFLSGQELYNEAFLSRQLYTDALKKNKKCAQGYLSYGLWLFFAPPVAGGGHEAALKEFSKAVAYSKTSEEKYFALLYRSQAYSALENEKKAAADLRAAHELFPNELFTEFVAQGNKSGKLFFE